jgi:spore maturation protein CgeB
MRFLIITTDYPEFLHWLYAEHPGLEKQPYEEQMRARVESLFGAADFYSSNLRKLGHEAHYIFANNKFMQKAWASEQGIRFVEVTPVEQAARTVLRRPWRMLAKTPLRRLERPARSVLYSLDKGTWFYDILAAQIKHHKPDVLLNHNMDGIGCRFLSEMKPYVQLLVGQHAATSLSNAEDFGCYDLSISSFPPTIDYFRQKGIPAELHRLGFEPRVLSLLEDKERGFDVTFIGSFHNVHSSRLALLEVLCDKFEQIRIWGQNIDHLSFTSPIRKCYVGQAWGREMYQILRNSKITLNHHGDIAPYANNARLYEATGVGTLLITDWKRNLPEMFEPGKELVAYRTPEECAELIQYYLEHDDEREAIAHAGQERTLREHTYYKRMQELVDILERYLSYPKRTTGVISIDGSQK